MKKIAPALAAGNSIIVKPSEVCTLSRLVPIITDAFLLVICSQQAPITVLEFAEMAADAGGKRSFV